MDMEFHIDKFFRVSTETHLPDGTAITVRTLSDVELKARQAHAVSILGQTAQKLRNPESEEHKSRIAPLSEVTNESLVETLVSTWRPEWIGEARESQRMMIFPYPDDASDVEKADVDRKQKEHEQATFAERAKYLANRELAFREKVGGWDRETILKNVVDRAVGLYALDESLQEQDYYTIWRGVERDSKSHWASVDEVRQLNPKVVSELLRVYQEVDSQDPWELIKSLVPRDSERVGENHTNGKRNRRKSKRGQVAMAVDGGNHP